VSNAAVNLSSILPGFRDPVHDSQQTFRALLDVMARPGSIRQVARDLTAPAGLNLATAAIALTLFDFNVCLYLQPGFPEEAAGWLRFHCGVALTEETAESDFGIVERFTDDLHLDRFKPGGHENPALSTTLVIQVPQLGNRRQYRLTGPGIREDAFLSLAGVTDALWESRERLKPAFPCGIDLIFTCEDQVAAIPRTTCVELI